MKQKHVFKVYTISTVSNNTSSLYTVRTHVPTLNVSTSSIFCEFYIFCQFNLEHHISYVFVGLLKSCVLDFIFAVSCFHWSCCVFLSFLRRQDSGMFYVVELRLFEVSSSSLKSQVHTAPCGSCKETALPYSKYSKLHQVYLFSGKYISDYSCRIKSSFYDVLVDYLRLFI